VTRLGRLPLVITMLVVSSSLVVEVLTAYGQPASAPASSTKQKAADAGASVLTDSGGTSHSGSIEVPLGIAGSKLTNVDKYQGTQKIRVPRPPLPYPTALVGPDPEVVDGGIAGGGGPPNKPPSTASSVGTGEAAPVGLDFSAFDAVVAVGTASAFHCTGTVIGRRRVLTAKHCLPAAVIAVANDVTKPAQKVKVVGAQKHPDGLDVAVLTTEVDLLVDGLAWNSKGKLDGSLVRLVGFGATNAEGTNGFGVKRFVDVPALGWGCDGSRPETIGCRLEAEMVLVNNTENDTCSGDSGGPVLARISGRWIVVAVTSRSLVPGAACGVGGIYTRTDVISTWLDGLPKDK